MTYLCHVPTALFAWLVKLVAAAQAPLEELALVADTRQNLINLLFLDIYGACFYCMGFVILILSPIDIHSSYFDCHCGKKLVELELVKFQVSQTHRSYAQIIFLLAKGLSIRILKWLDGARTPPKFLINLTNSNLDHLCFYKKLCQCKYHFTALRLFYMSNFRDWFCIKQLRFALYNYFLFKEGTSLKQKKWAMKSNSDQQNQNFTSFKTSVFISI